MLVGIIDNQKPSFEQYVRWLSMGDGTLELLKLSYQSDNLTELDRCDGLVMTGGGDVDPALYGRAKDLGETSGVDAKRDEFELRAIERATKLAMPTLGICRGLQVANVYFHGSLIVDLESRGFARHRPVENEECRHAIQVMKGTTLSDVIGNESAEVNSAHHQAVDKLGSDLRVCAKSPDGVIEALEWADPAGKPFLLLVQWHPERMKDYGNRCSRNVLGRFLSEMKKSVDAQHV